MRQSDEEWPQHQQREHGQRPRLRARSPRLRGRFDVESWDLLTVNGLTADHRPAPGARQRIDLHLPEAG
jgi:hypothetical protein